MTVGQLLAHRSGIGDYLDEEADHAITDYVLPVPVHELAATEQYLQLLDGHPAKFAPDERFSYSNGGYVVLALIAERISGTPFHELVEQRVCEPAGMRDTEFLRSDELPGRVALGYLESDGARTNVFHLPVLGSGDGGVYSTAADLHRMWRALFAGRIVSADWVAEMMRPHNEVPSESMRYGLGFWLHQSRDAVMLEGFDAGASFRTVHDRAGDLHPHGPVEHLTRRLADHATPRQRPHTTVAVARGCGRLRGNVAVSATGAAWPSPARRTVRTAAAPVAGACPLPCSATALASAEFLVRTIGGHPVLAHAAARSSFELRFIDEAGAQRREPPDAPVPEPARRIRPRPRTLRPVHHETIDSYLTRLAAANALPAGTLQLYLGATPSRRNQALLDRLATASRQRPASLSRALVEFQYLGTGPPAYRPGTAFRRRHNEHGVAMEAGQENGPDGPDQVRRAGSQRSGPPLVSRCDTRPQRTWPSCSSTDQSRMFGRAASV